MLESLNYSFRNPKNIIWVIYRIKQLRNYKKTMWSSEDPSLINNVDELGLVYEGLTLNRAWLKKYLSERKYLGAEVVDENKRHVWWSAVFFFLAPILAMFEVLGLVWANVTRLLHYAYISYLVHSVHYVHYVPPNRAIFWMLVPCIWFEIRVNYQLDANICLF